MLQLLFGTGLSAVALPLSAARRAALRVGLISDLNSSYGSTSYIPAVDQGLNQLIQRKKMLDKDPLMAAKA